MSDVPPRTSDPDDGTAASQRQRRLNRLSFSTGVALASMCVGAGLGAFAGSMYQGFLRHSNGMEGIHLQHLGLSLGVGSALAVALAWCHIMYRRLDHRGAVGLVRAGTWWGVAAGATSTFLLHAPLYQLTGESLIAFGLLFGIPVGAVVGAISAGVLKYARAVR